MKKTPSQPVLVLTFMIVISVFGLMIMGILNQTDSIQFSSRAAESEPACPLTARIYVNELQDDGTEVPMRFLQNNTNPLIWGFADTINLPPYTETVIPFNAPDTAEYTISSKKNSFAYKPEEYQIYPSDQTISVTAMIDDINFEVVERRIDECSAGESETWRCGSQEDITDMHTISNIDLTCDMNLELGWVVKRRSEPGYTSSQFSETNPIQFSTTDLNGDGIASAIDLTIIIASYGKTDPSADVNKDGKINVIDYQLVSDAIRAGSRFDNPPENEL